MLRISVFLIASAIGVTVPHTTHAQTGPGGVDNATNVSMWLKADDLNLTDGASVSTWSDASGNGNDAIQNTANNQPTYEAASPINSKPSVRFNGGNSNSTSDFMTVADDDALDNTTGLTFYAVLRSPDVNSPGVSAIFGKRQQFSNTADYAYVWFFWSGRDLYLDLDNSSDRFRTNTSFAGNTNYIASASFDGTLSASSRASQYINGSTDVTDSESSTSIKNSTQDLLIGTMNQNYGQYYNGYFSELIIFRKALNTAERTIVDNYLGAKYDISIANSHYAHQATHSYQLIGIGQASDGTNHTTSTGDGILTMSSPNALGNGEFLMVAHDGSEADLVDTCDAPGEYGARLERVWKVGHTGDVGTVSFEFDLSGVTGLGAQADLALIQSSTSDFTNATVHTTGINLSGTTLSFTGVDLNDGDIFTVAQLGSTVIWNGATWANGSGASNTPTTADASKKLLISDAGATLSSDASCECAEIASGADLSIDASVTLVVANGITNDGDVVVASTGSLVQTGSTANSGSGSYEIQRNSGTINDDTRFQYWASPVQNTSMGAVFTGSNTSDFYFFNNSTDNWASQASGSTMTPGVGYITTGTIGISNASETRVFSGTVNNNTVNLSTADVSSGESILAGNPYPSAINSTTFVTENTGINGTIWFWNHFTRGSDGMNFQADYATWTMTGATTGNGSELPDDYIQSCQGFFVEALAVDPTISFNNGQRVSGNNSQFFKRNNRSENHRVWMALTNDSNDFNQLLIGFLPEATDGVDRLYDGKKYKAHPRSSFYSVLDSTDYAIQGLDVPQEQEAKRIPLGVDAWITGDFTIYIDSLDNWPEHYSLFLIDEQKLVEQNLKANPEYTFQVDNTGEIRDRFFLAVRNEMEPVDTIDQPTNVPEAVVAREVKVFAADGDIVVTSEGRELSSITVHDMTGRLLLERQLRGSFARIPMQVGTGITIVSVQFNDASYHKQLIMR